MQTLRNKSLRWANLLIFLAILLSFGLVSAQDDNTDQDEDQTEESADDEDVADLERIRVTGSLLLREDFTSVSPMQVIDAETQFQAGNLTAADILQESSVAAGTTQLNNQFNGFVVQGGTGVETLDLRGLGATRTLTLLNGRRPGGSGTRGQVNAVDLSVIPDLAVTRYEIVLDGSSSIYGSDALAGVANIITRRSVDQTEVSIAANVPQESGGQFSRVGFITGLNFDRGSMTLSAQYSHQEALRFDDRSFLRCGRDLIRDADGNLLDREDRSITAGTALGDCPNNLYANTVINAFDSTIRYIPSPDGTTIGPIPGYRPRDNGRYDDPDFNGAFYEDQLNFGFLNNQSIINEQERLNVYATADFSFGNVDWNSDLLYSNRETTATGWRQFFPLIGGASVAGIGFGYANDPDYEADPTGELVLFQPVVPYQSDANIEVEFIYASTGFSGVLPTDSFWSWDAYATYSRSDGDYNTNAIAASRSGDARFDADAPQYNPFDPCILSGQCVDQLRSIIGADLEGNTVYEQWSVTGIVAGDLFELPAGTVGSAFGIEYRDFSIDDQPDPLSQAGDIWGQSSAITTKGSNNVGEAFAEIEVPILAGITGVESLTLNGSARYFDYDVGGSDWVWKLGVNWQVVPSVRLRSTLGTSYRAPALFEQFLGDQTGFLGQNQVDPCIDWGESTNENIRRNCAAIGIPDDYAGVGSSVLTISGGGVDNLESETSDAFTAGIVFTPEFANLNIALDYYEIEVNDQIAQLGARQIALGCYSGDNFPNAFCDLLVRLPGDDPTRPNQIESVDDTFININTQKVRGVDLNMTYNQNFDWGSLNIETQSTYQIENTFQLFDPSEVAGFNSFDTVGDIGVPELVTNFRASAQRNDWRFTYALQYASETDESRLRGDEQVTYVGEPNAFEDYTVDAWWSHSLSVLYTQDSWDFLIGVDNILDTDPDLVSDGVNSTVVRNVDILASQQSLLGRTFFGRIAYRF